MLEFLPYLLIAVGWSPAAPADSMAVTSTLHASSEACEAKRGELAAKAADAGDAEQPSYRFFCIEAPGAAEYDRLFESLK